jgi:speckle-type POZ protein
MAPAAGVGGPLRSASAIVADTTQGYHILRIDGYSLTKGTSTGDYIKSHPFTVGGHRWYIRYYPNGSKPEVKDYISFYLYLVEARAPAKVVKVQFQFRFVSEVPKKRLTSEEVKIFEGLKGWGYTKFIQRTELEKSEHLRDDSFAVRCDIVVTNDFRAVEEKAEVATPDLVVVPPSDLHQHLGDLLQTETGADVVFHVGTETFAAHRCVLAARSPVSSAELFGTMKECDTGGVVRIEEIEAQVFKALLHFVYTDSLPKVNIKGRSRGRCHVSAPPCRSGQIQPGEAETDM